MPRFIPRRIKINAKSNAIAGENLFIFLRRFTLMKFRDIEIPIITGSVPNPKSIINNAPLTGVRSAAAPVSAR